MSESSIYLDREDAKKVEEEERNIFIKGVLDAIGVPLEVVWPDILIDTVDQKIKLRKLLSQLEIDIIEDGDRGCKIYWKNKLAAEWFKPRFILKEDKTAIKFSKKLFYEMIIKTWSVFESQPHKEI